MNILILCKCDIHSNPRPNRLLKLLRDEHEITVMSTAREEGLRDGVRYLRFKETRSPIVKKALFFAKLGYLLSQLYLVYDRLFCNFNERHRLSKRGIDLVIVEDCGLLPLAWHLKKKNGVPVLFDAREYFPRHFEDSLFWKIFFRGYFRHLCAKYLHRCDRVISVGPHIAWTYSLHYGIPVGVYMSLPEYADIKPGPVDPNHIKVLYHGNCTPARKIENLIEMVSFLPAQFELYLVLVNVNDGYYKHICRLARSRRRVHILEPVPYHEIETFSNGFDIGMLLFPDTTFNLKYCLPNKLFQYLQSRLAVATGPSPELAAIVRRYRCGVVGEDYTAKAVADAIRRLTPQDIERMKNKSDNAAKELHLERNRPVLREILRRLPA